MKMLKKLALVSAISIISAGAFAMEAMDDESMASATGQDGITILVKPGVMSDATVSGMGVSTTTRNLIDNAAAGYYANSDDTFAGLSIGSIVIHDDDGVGTGATANSGALVIGGGYDKNGDGDFLDAGDKTTLLDRTVLVADGSKGIVIDVDMVGSHDGTGTGTAMLNVKISTPRLGIKTGDIYVANSDAVAEVVGVDANSDGDYLDVGDTAPVDDVDGTSTSGKIKIMSGLELVVGEATTTIQLGTEAQGHMVVANTTLVGGLTINNLEVFDAGGTLNPTLGTVVTTGGSFYASSLSIKNSGGTDLSVIANVDIGSANTTAFDAGQITTIDANFAVVYPTFAYVPVSARDAATKAVTSNAYTTYAALLDVANGADNVLGNVDDDATAAAQVAAVQPAALAATRSGARSTLQAGAQAAFNGLVIEMAQFGDATNGADLTINDIRLGDSTAKTLGDVQILGLNINGTIAVISGH